MSLDQLDALKVAPLELPPYSVHTQSCERALKLVTEAAESVCGWAKRDGFIRTQMRDREVESCMGAGGVETRGKPAGMGLNNAKPPRVWRERV